MIDAQGLGVRYGATWVLHDVSLRVADGEFVALLGPSGCGKSTLLRVIAGLQAPSAGELFVSGTSPDDFRREPGGIGLVFQDPRLLPWRSVDANIRLPLELDRVARSVQHERVESTVALVGLSLADRSKYPRMLSGGMRMRVSLARALATEPRLLLLDEPFAALDDILRTQLNDELLRIWSATKTTTIFVTHNVAEAVYLSQRVIVMGRNPGRVAGELRMPWTEPRDGELRQTAEFARVVGLVSEKLREVYP